ncbi:MAG: pyridoxal-dependent decarboxylase, partial [Actinomycetes bacterium]
MNAPDSPFELMNSAAPKGYEVLDQAARISLNYLANVADRPVSADTGDGGTRRLEETLGGFLQNPGESPERVIERLAGCAPRGVVASGGPRFFGYVVGGAHPVALAADWLVSSWDQFAATFDAGPAVAIAEQTALDWVIDLLGLAHRRPISGGFTTGTTGAHLTAIAAARHALLVTRGWDVETEGLWGAPPFPVLVGRDV